MVSAASVTVHTLLSSSQTKEPFPIEVALQYGTNGATVLQSVGTSATNSYHMISQEAFQRLGNQGWDTITDEQGRPKDALGKCKLNWHRLTEKSSRTECFYIVPQGPENRNAVLSQLHRNTPPKGTISPIHWDKKNKEQKAAAEETKDKQKRQLQEADDAADEEAETRNTQTNTTAKPR